MSSADNLQILVREATRRVCDHGSVAIAELYDLTAVRLVRFAVTITRSHQDAEDAVANALMRVVADPNSLVEALSPWSYLLRMVHNESLLVLRKRKRWAAVQRWLQPWIPSSDCSLERIETSNAIGLALRRLTTEQSEVVVLKVWEGMTFQQIGEVLGIPSATAASRYRYALNKLSHLLEPTLREVHHE